MPQTRMKFYGEAERVSDPGDQAEEIVPNDTTELPNGPCKGVYVGTGGDITMKGPGDSDFRVWKNAQSGSIIPFRALIIHTDTTALDLLAIY